jgi:arginine/lysine/ornithine decarboxylase
LEREKNVQAVILTSPSYDGVVSDVKTIGEIVHKKGIPLIVDEAHGAHFGFHPYFPKNSVELGADLVIHSLHKTLPSLTQTALLHVNGDLVDREKLAMYLGIYQTSSPSYVFMAGMDECVWLLKEKSGELFTDLKENLQEFYGKVEKLSHIHVADKSLVGHSGIYDFDVSKLVLKVEENGGIYDGNWLAEKLRRDFEIELEMAGVRYGLALSSCMDSREGFVRLADALRQIDKEIGQEKENKKENRIGKDRVTRNEVCCKINEALDRPGKTVPLLEAEGEVSREFAYLYPPGIPLLVPGEIISLGVIEKMKELMGRGYSLQGMKDYSGTFIQVAE